MWPLRLHLDDAASRLHRPLLWNGVKGPRVLGRHHQSAALGHGEHTYRGEVLHQEHPTRVWLIVVRDYGVQQRYSKTLGPTQALVHEQVTESSDADMTDSDIQEARTGCGSRGTNCHLGP